MERGRKTKVKTKKRSQHLPKSDAKTRIPTRNNVVGESKIGKYVGKEEIDSLCCRSSLCEEVKNGHFIKV